jgi:hypothetical protein
MTMKVREDSSGDEYEVYGIYWRDRIKYFYVQFNDGYCGLGPLTQNECDVIDPSIDNFILVDNVDVKDFFLHKAAFEGGLLDDLIEHIPEAVEEFERRLAEYKSH